MVKKIFLFIIWALLSNQLFPMNSNKYSSIKSLEDISLPIINSEKIKLAISRNRGNYESDKTDFIKDLNSIIINSLSKTEQKVLKIESIIALSVIIFSLFKLKQSGNEHFIYIGIPIIIGIILYLLFKTAKVSFSFIEEKAKKENIAELLIILFENYSIEEVEDDDEINIRKMLPRKFIPAFDYLYKKISQIDNKREKMKILLKESLKKTFKMINNYIREIENSIYDIREIENPIYDIKKNRKFYL